MRQVAERADIAFTAAEAVSAGSLSAALIRLVFRAPELELLRRGARQYAKKHKFQFNGTATLLERPCADCFEMLALRNFVQPRWDHDPPTVEERRIERLYFSDYIREGKATPVSRFEDAMHQRASTLIGMLQEKQIVGWGHTASGHLTLISNSIWAHPSYYIRLETGDVIHVDDEENVTIHWRGVILLFPGQRPETAVRVAQSPIPQLKTERAGGNEKAGKGVALERIRERAYDECYRWMREMMAASPDRKLRTRGQLEAEAMTRWSNLSPERFYDAWRQAARDAKALCWRSAGAPKRNPPVD